MPKIYLAADHAGFALKEVVKGALQDSHEVIDCTETFTEGDDYPDLITPCVENVAGDAGSLGVVIGASGQGEAMTANRVRGVRAAVYYGSAGKQIDADGSELSMLASVRAHNHANVLSLGARFLSEEEAIAAVHEFIAAPVSDDARHIRRIEKLG